VAVPSKIIAILWFVNITYVTPMCLKSYFVLLYMLRYCAILDRNSSPAGGEGPDRAQKTAISLLGCVVYQVSQLVNF
jgi:hypothetical protein